MNCQSRQKFRLTPVFLNSPTYFGYYITRSHGKVHKLLSIFCVIKCENLRISFVWDMTLHHWANCPQHFKWMYSLLSKGQVNQEEFMVTWPWTQRQHISPKNWQPLTQQHSITSHKSGILNSLPCTPHRLNIKLNHTGNGYILIWSV
jgi:hypothetical protein